MNKEGCGKYFRRLNEFGYIKSVCCKEHLCDKCAKLKLKGGKK